MDISTLPVSMHHRRISRNASVCAQFSQQYPPPCGQCLKEHLQVFKVQPLINLQFFPAFSLLPGLNKTPGRDCGITHPHPNFLLHMDPFLAFSISSRKSSNSGNTIVKGTGFLIAVSLQGKLASRCGGCRIGIACGSWILGTSMSS